MDAGSWQDVENKGSARFSWVVVAAAAWCIAFAVLHLFWALGGSAGLASSAGRDLAARRPASFVIFGLYGVAVALLLAAAVIGVATIDGPHRRRRRAAVVLVGVVGAGLLLRGVALELLLATNAAGLRRQVGPLEAHWSQILWNPWFALGGILFIATAIHLRSQIPVRQQPQ